MIEFNEFSFRYREGEAPVVRDITLAIPDGCFVGITGAAGSGKSTLTYAINGIIPHCYPGDFYGSVTVEGCDTVDTSLTDLSRLVGSVCQDVDSQMVSTVVEDEILYGLENFAVPRDEIPARVDEALAAMGIADLRDRTIDSLSGGQKQKVAVASVLALRPRVLVLDEPTASLDVGAMLQLAEAVARLKAAGKTVLVAEHRLWWLAGIADRVVVMRGGRVVRDADAAAFARIGEDERARLGLRAWDLARVSPARRGDGSAASGARAADEAPALDAAGLEAGYGRDAPVLRGAGLRLDAGTVTALVGRNGAGKTTLSRCLVGLRRERAGSVRFRGEEPRRRDRPEHAYLVMQETGYQLFSDTVRGELLGALTHGGLRPAPDGADGQADRALARFGLEDIAERHPLSLSGGQRQRLAIAVGILQGARVLVLDEPTSGLDFGTMGRVADEVRRARDAGACIVVVTHDYEFVCAACDQVAVLEDGVVSDVLPVRGEALGRIRRAIGIDGRARPL